MLNLHLKTKKSSCDLSTAINDQNIEFAENRLTDIDSITVHKTHRLDKELVNKKYVDESLRDGTILKFSQILCNYNKVKVKEVFYILISSKKTRNYRHKSYQKPKYGRVSVTVI